MRVSLIVDVEDVAGYREGLPALLKLFSEYQIQATFLFSLGYDNSGLRIKNFFKPTVLNRQLPFTQKFYGTLLPPPSLSKKFKSLIKDCAADGHDIGLKSFDSVTWQSHALTANLDWTKTAMQWSIETFHDLLGYPPSIHSASGFVINEHLLMLEQQLGFKVGLDTRGKSAYLPEYQSVRSQTPQLPVTLASIEELLLSDEIDLDNVHEYLFVESQQQLPHGHVYQVRAAYEGRAWLDILEKIMVMWRSTQWEFNRVTEVIDSISADKLMTHQVGWAQYKPHNRYMATQSLPVDISDKIKK